MPGARSMGLSSAIHHDGEKVFLICSPEPPFAGSDLDLDRQKRLIPGLLICEEFPARYKRRLSEFSRSGGPNENVAHWLKSLREESLFVSVLTIAEIRRGIELLASGKRRTLLERWLEDLLVSFEQRLLPVSNAIGNRWAVLSAQAQRRGVSLANFDGLIAATAAEHDLTLVTRNVKDFADLGLAVLNPWGD